MFWRTLVITLLAALLAVSVSAAAPEEQQLSPDYSSYITATPGWVSWRREYYEGDQTKVQWRLWHGGALVPSPQVSIATFGTDSAGRAVALDSPCDGCRRVERRLADGSVRPLPRRVVGAADESGGTLAYVRRGLGIYVLRRGARRVVRVSRVEASSLALGGRWLVYWDQTNYRGETTIDAIDLSKSKPRARVLSKDDHSDDFCRCMTSTVSQGSPTIDGHFAYWIEEVEYSDLDSPNRPPETRILRVNLNARSPEVQRFSLPRQVLGLAVAGGTLYYPGGRLGSGEGVFRLRAPDWRSAGDRIPVQS
jgi:hypothetical protein